MKVTVLGTGGWGLTLGQVVYENKCEVSFWTNSQAEVDLLSTEHQYKDKLPGVIFPADFKYTTDMNAALDGFDRSALQRDYPAFVKLHDNEIERLRFAPKTIASMGIVRSAG